jgi:hypothetical protein
MYIIIAGVLANCAVSIGQLLQVTRGDATRAVLPGVYCKVYYKPTSGGPAKFLKDGYTDLRGVFEYASTSTGELEAGKVRRFAVLVMSEQHGAAVKEAGPPDF